jgi:hypothetical protein
MSTPARRPLVLFFILAFAITWGLAALYFLIPTQLTKIFGPISGSNPIFVLAVWAPTISGFIVAARQGGGRGVVGLLARFPPGRASVYWYLLVVLVVPAVSIAINLITGTHIALLAMSSSSIISFLFLNLVTGPLGEEFGWRGVALPRLLEKFPPLPAALILGFVWGLWHVPSFMISGTPQSGIQLPFFFLGAIAMSIIITWVFIHVNGRIFFSFLFHYVVNFTLSVLSIPFWQMAVLLTAFVVIIVGASGWDLGRKSLAAPASPAASP